MSANPWDKFFWNDWENDPELKLCSLAAQGLWMRMLCICAKAEPKGYLLAAGRPLTPADMAVLVGRPEREVETLMTELASAGVFSRDRKERVYNRRMVRAEQRASISRQNGKLGGNPSLSNQGEIQTWDNPPLKAAVKPHKPEANSQEKKKDAAVPAQPNLSETPEAEYFRRGKSIGLTGATLNQLLLAKGRSVPLARAALELATTKGDAREYIYAIIQKRDPVADLRARGDAW